jgi:chromate transport protein ChrA
MSATLARRYGSARELADAGYGWLGYGLIALGAGLALLALLGPLGLALIDYRVSETLRNQTIGLDAITLGLVAPAAVALGVLALRQNPAAPVLALGPAVFSVYMLVQYVLGPDYLHRPGNNERFFLFYLALFVLAGALGLRAWNAIDSERLPAVPRARLLGRVLLPLAGLLVFARYVPLLLDAARSRSLGSDYAAGPTFFWTIALLDLGVGLPTLVAAAVGLQRRRRWAAKALWILVAWLALVGPAVAAMATVMYLNDDPNASAASLALMTGLAVALVALAVFVFWPLRSASAKRVAR